MFEFDDNGFPRVQAKKVGLHEPCWCGSGKKFKICHYRREEATPSRVGKLLHDSHELFYAKKCQHPESPQKCGRIIRAHTIQRLGAISDIVDERKKVSTFYPSRTDDEGRLILH